jgi:hypothetical protein
MAVVPVVDVAHECTAACGIHLGGHERGEMGALLSNRFLVSERQLLKAAFEVRTANDAFGPDQAVSIPCLIPCDNGEPRGCTN